MFIRWTCFTHRFASQTTKFKCFPGVTAIFYLTSTNKYKQKVQETLIRSNSICGNRNKDNDSGWWPFCCLICWVFTAILLLFHISSNFSHFIARATARSKQPLVSSCDFWVLRNSDHSRKRYSKQEAFALHNETSDKQRFFIFLRVMTCHTNRTSNGSNYHGVNINLFPLERNKRHNFLSLFKTNLTI